MNTPQNASSSPRDLMTEVMRRWSVDRAKSMAGQTVLAVPPTSAPLRFWRRFRRQKAALVAAAVVVLLILLAIFGEVIYPVNPNEYNLSLSLLPFGTEGHPLGTDIHGRDVLSRLISGARVSLAAAGLAVLVATVLGVPLGLMAGMFRGKVDQLLSLVSDSFMTFPALLLAIAIVAARGPGLVNSMVAVGVTQAPRLFRLVRGVVMSVREETYVDVSRSIGTSNTRIALTHILPNMMAPVLVQLSVIMARAMLIEASLSFLGLGVTQPQASWGSILSDAQRYMSNAPLMIFWPGICIAITVLALNVLGDGLRDSLGREMREGR